METVKIGVNELRQYYKTQTLYFHDSHILSFDYSDDNAIFVFEKYDRSIIKLKFASITKIEYRKGDSNEIDFRNRILDIDIKPDNNNLFISILMFNMSFIDIYCTNIILIQNY